MPERMTKQEAKVEQTIRVLRKTKELLEQDINVLPYGLGEKDGLGETVKVKKPKADKADKITNRTQKEQGYGLAGEVFGKNNSDKDKVDLAIDTLTSAMHKFITTIEEFPKDLWEGMSYDQDDLIKEVFDLKDDLSHRLFDTGQMWD